MIRLIGTIDAVFGSFICFRGFAPFSVLSTISKPDENYQRSQNDSHVIELRNFLIQNISQRFFPEIILGSSWPDCGINESNEIDTLLHNTTQTQQKTYRGNGITVVINKPQYKSATTRLCTFNLKNSFINNKPFFRIDGNHRLLALPNSDDDTTHDANTIGKLNIPFCIVMFLDTIQYQKNGALFFHNINYRAIPIPEEKNLSIILENKGTDGFLFTDTELKNRDVFGLPYYQARKIIEASILELFTKLSNILNNEKFTFIVNIMKLLEEKKLLQNESETNELEINIRKAFLETENVLNKYNILTKAKRSVLEAIVFCFISGNQGENFARWIAENRLADIADISPSKAISLFEKIHKRGPYRVFVAMPYVSFKRVNDFNKLFREALNELNCDGTNGIKYELTPIMRFQGASQRIDQRLIKCIRECDIFVADITGNNANVIFEVGLAEGANKPIFLIKQDNDDKPEKVFIKNDEYIKNNGQVPFDMDKLQYIPYSSTGYYNDIKGIVKRNLPVIVKELLDQD